MMHVADAEEWKSICYLQNSCLAECVKDINSDLFVCMHINELFVAQAVD